jgi:hypothetical protein
MSAGLSAGPNVIQETGKCLAFLGCAPQKRHVYPQELEAKMFFITIHWPVEGASAILSVPVSGGGIPTVNNVNKGCEYLVLH